ncbi:S-adenosyl-L-methionine-dependent methyltransferase [Aspergillus pseudoustus]|uniref:S-adenosyl-L-methionine-dependent methyltransferase n=1 Tax=Aspergillus pseudoustus TaxID=1810923 RepID=A0ABR4INR8_9EURO
MTTVADLTATITSAIKTLPPPESLEYEERIQLIEALHKLRDSLESPMELLIRISHGQFPLAVARIAQAMGIFEAFIAAPSHELTISELSTKAKGDDKLISRIMRFLAAHDIFEATGPEKYKATRFVLALKQGTPLPDTLVFIHDYLPITARLYDFLKATGYQNPEDTYNSPFQFAHNTADHYFTWLGKHPESQATFNAVMNAGRFFRNNWFEFYPVVENLTGGAPDDPDRALVVDIGGNIGHELIAFRKRFPDIPGRLVLEDLPAVIDNLSGPLGPNIDAVKHNMFEPQPIKGARAYYLRTVLHDWPDKQCLQALKHIRDAMALDSVLLVHEVLSPDTTPRSIEASNTAVLDLMMMEVFSSLERTEAQWIELIERAGFRMNKVYKPGFDTHFSFGLFEAVAA